MNNNEVEIIKPCLTENVTNGFFGISIAFCFGSNFAGDKKLFTPYLYLWKTESVIKM